MAKWDIKLTEESEKAFRQLAEAGKIDFRPTLETIGISYRKEVQLIYDHQQPRNAGLRWAPLSDNPPGKGYASWKARHYPGAPILVRSGRLKASMVKLGSVGNISIITKTGAIFGSSILYGVYHDSDGPRSGSLPRRNFSEPSEKRLKIWTQQVVSSIQKNFERNGITVEGGITE